MTHAESLAWAQYIRQRGSLNIARRLEKQLETSTALLCTVVNNSAGGKAKFSDFMPGTKTADQLITDIGQVAGMLKSIAKPGKATGKKVKYTRKKRSPT